MSGRILYVEWLRQLRSKTQLLLVFVACVLLLGALYTHWRHQIVLSEAQQYWQETADSLWANQPDRHPHRVAHYGHVVVRPSAPLAFIEPGVSPYLGNYLFLEAHRQNSSSIKSSSINPATMRMGYPSVASIMLVMWPLLLIVLGYGTFSHEWDSGRLIWLSSLGASVWQLFIGKIGSLVFYTVMLLLLIFFSSLALLAFSEDWSIKNIADLLALLSVFAGYSVIWLVLILAVSFYSRNGQQSLWRLLTLWLLISIVLPKTANGVAEFIYPIPDRANFDAIVEKAVHDIGDAHNPDDPHFSEFKARVLSQYQVKTIEELPVNWSGLVMAEGERITSEIFQQHYDEVLKQFEAQDKYRLWFGLVSPVIAIQDLSQKIAQTDRASAQHFEASAEAFRYALVQELNHLHSHEIERERNRTQKISSDVWKNMALYEYSAPVNRHPGAVPVFSLMLWGLIVLILLRGFWRGEVKR